MAVKLTSKQRAYLRSMAVAEEPIFHVGKESVTPAFTGSVDEALSARELVKISVLKNCDDDVAEIGRMLSERTRSVLVQTVGRKITLYRPAKEPRIILPK